MSVYISEDEYDSIEDYLQQSHMDRDGVWGTTAELLVFAHLAGVNIASYNNEDGSYHILSPGVIEPDDARPSIYLVYSGWNHFSVTLTGLK